MPRQVKCQLCRKQIPITDAYKVVEQKRNFYYCCNKHLSQAEANKKQRMQLKEAQDSVYYKLKEITGQRLSWSVFTDSMRDLCNIDGYRMMYGYISGYESYLSEIVIKKSFKSSWHMTKYLAAVIRNNMAEHPHPTTDIFIKPTMDVFDAPAKRAYNGHRRRTTEELEALA